ncbi:MAG: hypothetical protein LBE08_05505 [Bifidobacteriaceae bacterium]|nr:hypothetical protein [Bifidobacteriaceae bacterium]
MEHRAAGGAAGGLDGAAGAGWWRHGIVHEVGLVPVARVGTVGGATASCMKMPWRA